MELIVFAIERCWAHAMEFKFESLDKPLSRKKFGMRQKFRKAAKFSHLLNELVKDNELVFNILIFYIFSPLGSRNHKIGGAGVYCFY